MRPRDLGRTPGGPPVRMCAILAVAAFVAILLAACGSSGDSESGDSSGDSWAKAQEAAQSRVEKYEKPITSIEMELPSIPDGPDVLARKRILVVPLASTIFATMQATIAKGIEAAGGTVRVCDGKANPTEIATCLASAKTSNVDGVITIAVSPDIAGESYRELERERIPTYAALQNSLGTPESDLLRFQDSVPTLKEQLRVATDYAIATSDEPLETLLIGNNDSKTVQEVNKEWFAETKRACTGCTQYTASVTTAQAPQVAGIVSSQLIQHPEINTIMTFNVDVFGPPALEGLANSAQRPRLGGSGSGGPGLTQIKQGRYAFDAATSLYFIGWASVDGLMREIAGVPAVEYPPVIRLFDSENVSELDLAPQNEASFEWFGTAPIEQQFQEAWGL